MQVNGVIEQIWYGTPKETEYGKSCPCAITVNNKRYSCFVKEFGGIYKLQKKIGDTYTDINKGMQVVFEATQKGDYWNFKTADLMILNSGGTGAPQPTQSTNAPQTTTNTTQQQNVPKNDSNDAITKFCDGLAALIAAYKFKDREMPPQEQIDRVSTYIKKMFG